MKKLRAALLLVPAVWLLLHPDAGADTIRTGLTLCAQRVIPSLFPFLVLSALLIDCGAADALGRRLARGMEPLFGVGGAGAAALALGLVGGYPVGAQTVASLRARGSVSRAEAERLLSFCCCAGPGFLLGVCGAEVFGSTRAGLYLYLVHVLAALLTGLLLRGQRLPAAARYAPPPADASLLRALPSAMRSAVQAMANICAYVVLFPLLLRPVTMLFGGSTLLRAALYGFCELTGGVLQLPATRGGFVLCAALLGWGGCSVHAQTLGVLAPAGLSMRPYLRGKAMQSLLSVPLAYIASQWLF